VSRQACPLDPDVLSLRELARTEESLGEDLRRVVNQLHQLLLRYYPQSWLLLPFSRNTKKPASDNPKKLLSGVHKTSGRQ
jgi:hypothetical protein